VLKECLFSECSGQKIAKNCVFTQKVKLQLFALSKNLVLSAWPKMDYITQLIAPNIANDACQWFDTQVMSTSVNKLKLNGIRDATVYEQLTMPIKQGGFALRQTCHTRWAAYVSTMAKIHKLDSAFWSYINDNMRHDIEVDENYHTLQPIVSNILESSL
jgi:hypothetical protein